MAPVLHLDPIFTARITAHAQSNMPLLLEILLDAHFWIVRA